MALWGSAANVTQLLGLDGLDIFKLISMIVKGAETVRRNEEKCRQISDCASMIKDRLEQLQQLSRSFEHPEMWKPIQGLMRTLGRAYKLIRDCQHRSYAYKLCAGSNIAHELESVQKDMDAWNQHLTNIKLDIIFSAFTVVLTQILHGNRNTIELSSSNRPSVWSLPSIGIVVEDGGSILWQPCQLWLRRKVTTKPEKNSLVT